MNSAAYATNVRHYSHVVAAMAEDFSTVEFMGPTEFSPQLLDNLRRWTPGPVHTLLSRRKGGPLPPNVRRLSPSVGANLPSIRRFVTGRPLSPREVRLAHAFQARAVARKLSAATYLQTVEGLGHIAMRRGSSDVVMERRNLHHEVFEEDVETFGGFPFQARVDPIRDILLEEYERAHRIVVYSEVAKESFIDRGFDPARLWVSPLPFTLPRVPHSASRARRKLLYVGRLDAYKGIDVAVEVVRRLPPGYSLFVAGPGGPAEREWLAKQDRVTYLGVVPKSVLLELYSSAGALLAPSIESFGLAILDAAMCGLPVFVRETTGVKDYLAPHSATIVVGRDPEKWVRAILASEDSTADTRPSTASLAPIGHLTPEAALANQRLLQKVVQRQAAE